MGTNSVVLLWPGSKKEVDFIVKEKDNSSTAIQVCYTDAIPGREVQSLEEWRCIEKGKLLLITKNLEKEEQGIHYIPLWKFLMEEG